MSVLELPLSATQLGLPQPVVRKTDAWQHQLQAYHAADGQPSFLLAMDMGTGKSNGQQATACNALDTWGR